MSALPSAVIEPGAKVSFTDTLGLTSEGVLCAYAEGGRHAEVRHRGGPLDGFVSIVPVAWLRPCPPPVRSGHPAPVERRVRKDRKRS